MSKCRLCVVLGLVALLGVPFLAGCGSTGIERTEAKFASMGQLQAEMNASKKGVMDVNSALDGVVASPSDPKSAYQNLVTQVTALEAQREIVCSRVDALKVKANECFFAWSADLDKIQDPDLRLGAEERKTQSKARFDKIRMMSQDVKSSYDSYWQNLQDLKMALGNDLNAEGIAKCTPTINTTKELGTKLLSDIDKVSAEFGAQAAAKAAGAAPEPK